MLKLPDAEVVVGDELRRVVLRCVGENEGGDVAQGDHRDANEEEDLLPHLPAVIGVGAGHLSQLRNSWS